MKTDMKHFVGNIFLGIQSAVWNVYLYIRKKQGYKSIIFDATEPTLIPFIAPILESIKSNKIDIYILKNSHIYLNSIDTDLIRDLKQIDLSYAKNLKHINMFVSPHIYIALNKIPIRLHISHNQPVKYLSLPKTEFESYTDHFLVGPLHYKQALNTIKSYKLAISVKHLHKVGYPKSDKLYSGKYRVKIIKQNLGLDLHKKTIIYSPSWESGLSLQEHGKEIFDVLGSLNNYNIIIKLHPVSYTNKSNQNFKLYTGGIEWEKLLDKYTKIKHIVKVTDSLSDPYIAISDLMITDLSGIALEFISINKPVLYIDCPNFFKLNSHFYKNYGDFDPQEILNNPISNAGRDVGYIVKRISDLKKGINYLISHPKYKLKQRLNRAKQLRYHKGHATEFAVNKIYELLSTNSL